MKSNNIYIIAVIGATILTPTRSNAVICAQTACQNGETAAQLVGCSMGSTRCYGPSNQQKAVYYCTSCMPGWTLKTVTGTASGCTYTAQECEEDCTGCTNCTSDTSWSAHSTGYEKKVTRTCSCNTCNATTSYRCAAGYYGSSSNGTTGCARCPSNGNSLAGTTSATGCYITSGSDTSGTFTYTSNCYYSN